MMAFHGAKVMHPRAVAMGIAKKMPVRVLSSFHDAEGTMIMPHDKPMEDYPITGIAHQRDMVRIFLAHPPEISIHFLILELFEKYSIYYDMFHKYNNDNQSRMSFVIPSSDYPLWQSGAMEYDLERFILKTELHLGKITLVGIGIGDQPGLVTKVQKTLMSENIPIFDMTNGGMHVSIVIPSDSVEHAVKDLHATFHLDKEPSL